MAAGSIIAISGVTLFLGLSSYLGFSQYQKAGQVEQENDNLHQTVSSLESEKAVLESQKNELADYTDSLVKSLAESQAKEQQYNSKIDDLTESIDYYRTQVDLPDSQQTQPDQSGVLSKSYTHSR